MQGSKTWQAYSSRRECAGLDIQINKQALVSPPAGRLSGPKGGILTLAAGAVPCPHRTV